MDESLDVISAALLEIRARQYAQRYRWELTPDLLPYVIQVIRAEHAYRVALSRLPWDQPADRGLRYQ